MTRKPMTQDTKNQAGIVHPGMMSDGTEEQNLNERRNPATLSNRMNRCRLRLRHREYAHEQQARRTHSQSERIRKPSRGSSRPAGKEKARRLGARLPQSSAGRSIKMLAFLWGQRRERFVLHRLPASIRRSSGDLLAIGFVSSWTCSRGKRFGRLCRIRHCVGLQRRGHGEWRAAESDGSHRRPSHLTVRHHGAGHQQEQWPLDHRRINDRGPFTFGRVIDLTPPEPASLVLRPRPGRPNRVVRAG